MGRPISQAEREAMSARKRAWWAIPENKAKIAQRQRERMRNDPAYREATFGAMTSFEAQQRCAQAVRESWADPKKRPQRSQRQAEIAKQSWANPAMRERRLAAIAAANATPQAKANRAAAARLARAKRRRGTGDEPVQVKKRRSRALERIPMDPLEARLFGGGR